MTRPIILEAIDELPPAQREVIASFGSSDRPRLLKTRASPSRQRSQERIIIVAIEHSR